MLSFTSIGHLPTPSVKFPDSVFKYFVTLSGRVIVMKACINTKHEENISSRFSRKYFLGNIQRQVFVFSVQSCIHGLYLTINNEDLIFSSNSEALT